MRCAFDTGCLHLSFLEIDGRKAAGYFSFNYLNRLWIYNSGLNRDFSELSPGWVLLGFLLKQANEEKFKEFDFLRGDENYKYKFGAIDRAVVRVTITR
jgi:CelD/BcsL family acetyltransferase involved in cellulose biosynthesis